MKVTNLSLKAMLVGLTIHGWQARKYDKKISAQVVAEHNASADAGRFNKHLLPGAAKSYDAVHKKGRELRTFYYDNTLPWSKDGQRILPAANYEAFSEGVRKFRREYELLAEAFIREYPMLKADAKLLLNGMYLESDYPTEEDMREKFDIRLETLPMPAAGDFRVALRDEEVDRIQKEIEVRLQKEIEAANRDLWSRLREAVGNMALRLGNPEGKFHDTLVSNLQDVCELIPRLNMTGDAMLEEIRAKCEECLTVNHPQSLRDDPVVRSTVAAQAKEISKIMDDYM